MTLSPPMTAALWRQGQHVSQAVANLVEIVSSYVEEHPARLLARRLEAGSGSGAPLPPRAPGTMSEATVSAYFAELTTWLDDVRCALKASPAGATAVVLAELGRQPPPPGPAGALTEVPLSELLLALSHIDDAAQLLSFYCGLVISA
ncbi:MAG TPA: hypothetical protein VFH51_14725 [Myxococcota bacterium]|nr:hypothetical protein [Myxococcota bacterium]